MSLVQDNSSWTRVSLGSVAAASKERVDASDGTVARYVAGEHMDSDDLKIHRWGDPSETALGPAFHRRFHPGQVLYGSRRTYLRKVAVADFDGVCANTTFVVQTRDPNRLLPEFLPFVMTAESFHAFAIAESKGSVNPYVNWSDIERYEFNLPSPNEQRRIADLLWAAERHIRAVSSAVNAATHLYESTRLALLSVGPKAWRRATVNSETANRWTVRVPAGWSAETIQSIGRVRSGATPARSQQQHYFDGGCTPWVKTLDLNEELVESTDEMITDSAVADTSAKVFPSGTVMIAMYGGFAQIGRTGRLGVAAATNQAISSVLDVRPDVDPVFLHEVLKAGRSKWRKVAASSRKDPNITKSDVEKFDFPLPPPDQQAEILTVLGYLRGMVDSVEEELTRSRTLQRSLLASALGGN